MTFLKQQVVADEVAVTKAGTSYSDAFRFTGASGFVAVQITTDAGSVTITQQCSLTGETDTWYDPVDSAGAALGAVVAAMTVGTKYIQPDPVLAPFIRYKIVEGNVAIAAVSITLVCQK